MNSWNNRWTSNFWWYAKKDIEYYNRSINYIWIRTWSCNLRLIWCEVNLINHISLEKNIYIKILKMRAIRTRQFKYVTMNNIFNVFWICCVLLKHFKFKIIFTVWIFHKYIKYIKISTRNRTITFFGMK